MKDVGDYHCIVCDQNLFPSHYKFFPTTGTSAFFASYQNATKIDNGEIECSKCSSHLGYAKDDGPAPTHVHLQVKSGALTFKPMPWFTVPPTRKESKAIRRKQQKKLESKKTNQ